MSESMQNKIDEVVHEFVMRAAGKIGMLRPEDIGRIAREAALKGCMIGWYEGVKAERKYMKLKESTGSK